MPVRRQFQRTASVQVLFATISSMAAHVAAKLAGFASDERTLTDDACDMFAIWSQFSAQHFNFASPNERALFESLPSNPIEVEIYKTTVHEESQIYGADLRLIVRTPDGIKDALFQAKVRDPDEGLRVTGQDQINKLREQLKMMRDVCDLSYFMGYVPAGFLEVGPIGIASWEQGTREVTADKSLRRGMTVIPVNDLLNPQGEWLADPFLTDNDDGTFDPPGISFGKLFLDMLVCNVGEWKDDDQDPKRSSSPLSAAIAITLDIGLSKYPPSLWHHDLDAIRAIANQIKD